MNIFATYQDPVKCAEALDDIRVVKMVLESCQMLNTVSMLRYNTDVCGYKPTHKNHPCTVWVATSFSNYFWLVEHMNALCKEYTARYNKVHKCEQYLKGFYGVKHYPSASLGYTPFVNCTNFKHIEDTHEAYRQCLLCKWREDKRAPTWHGQKAGLLNIVPTLDCNEWKADF